MKAVLLNDTTWDYHHGCEVVVSTIVSQLGRRGISVTHRVPVGQDWRADDATLEALKCCDLIVVNGEGTIHHGREAGRRLLEVAKHGAKLGKKSVLINSTYDSNPESFRELLEHFALIFVRETLSQAALESINIQSTVVPDLTLIRSENRPAANARSGIGATDSVYTELSEALFRLCESRSWRFLPIIRSYKNEDSVGIEERLRHLKHVVNNGATVIASAMRARVDYLRLRNLYVVPTTERYLDEIEKLELMIVARFHALCFCLVTETPFVTVGGNSHKVESLLTDLGMAHRLVEASAIAGTELKSFKEFSKQERAQLRSYKKEAITRIYALFDACAALAGSGGGEIELRSG